MLTKPPEGASHIHHLEKSTEYLTLHTPAGIEELEVLEIRREALT